MSAMVTGVLALQLRRLEWTQRRLAEETGLSAATVNDIMLGRRGVSPRVAVAFARVFPAISANTWLHWQADHDLERWLERHGEDPS